MDGQANPPPIPRFDEGPYPTQIMTEAVVRGYVYGE